MKRISFAFFIVLIALVLFLLGNDQGLVLAKIEGYRVLKTFIQLKDERLGNDFVQYEAEHFIIKHKAEDEKSLKIVADELERSYKIVGSEYKAYPEQKTVVFVYRDQQEMWNYQSSVSGQAVLGLYNLGTIHILSPNAYNSDVGNIKEYFVKNGPVLHEYTHKVVDDLAGGNIELWLTEGIALYEEYEKNGVEWEPGFEYAEYFTADELRNDFMAVDELQAYRQSFDTMKQLVEKHGKNKLTILLEKLKNGNTLGVAFKSVYGTSVDDFINSIRLEN